MQGTVMSSLGFQEVIKKKGNAENATIHVMNTSLKIVDKATRVKSALAMIESSIRNFDIVQAQLSFNGEDLELSSTFGAYYSDPATLSDQTRSVCADFESEKCKTMGGDTAEAEKKAAKNGTNKDPEEDE